MNAPNGSRQLSKEEQAEQERQRKERVKMIKEETEREELFSRGPTQRQLLVAPRETSTKTLEADLTILKQQAAETSAMLKEITQGLQQNLEQSKSIADTLDKQSGALDTLKVGIKNVLSKTDEVLRVSKSIKENTEILKRAYASGGSTALIKEVIFNERLLLFAYFILHPLAPITTETMLSVWLYPLTIYRGVKAIFYKDIDIQLTSASGIIYTFTVSQAALIGLMYSLVSVHADMRALQPDLHSELFSGTIENAGVSTVSWMMGIARGEEPIPGLPDGFTSSNITDQVEKMIDSIPGLWTTITDVCPTFKDNKAQFNICFAEYLTGKLVTTVGTITSFPGYAAQINNLVTAEGRLLGLLLQFFGSMLSYTLVGSKDKLMDFYSTGKEWVVGQASQLIKSVLGSWSPFSGGRRRKLLGGQGQLQMQMLMQRDVQFGKMSTDMKNSFTILTQSSAFFLDMYEIGEIVTRGKLKLAPEIKRALEVNIETGVLLLSAPVLTDEPILVPEDSKIVMKENAFQLFRDPTFSGGKSKRRHKTRRSIAKSRYTRKVKY